MAATSASPAPPSPTPAPHSVPAAPRHSLARVAQLTRQHGAQHFNLYAKAFVDELSHPDNRAPQRQASMIEQEPELVGEPWIDALLAGMAEFIAHRSDLPAPAWTEKPERFLSTPKFWGVRPETRAHMLCETPGPFRRRNLFCGYVWLHANRWDRP
ncbi:MAG: hypothetical protein N2256_02875 [Tepidimonas ignava]|nr:hypothetical protein [Tepidimonas ignava]